MRPRAVLACLLLAAGPRASSQALDPGKALTQYHVDTWDTADNLPQNSVTAILQSRDGYLWLGTYGGVGRFDGSAGACHGDLANPRGRGPDRRHRRGGGQH